MPVPLPEHLEAALRRRLPAMAALRAFEAVAQCRSVKRAAQMLHLTPSALSHQLRRLEAELEVRLFHREAGGLRLTAAGQAYLPAVREALDGLSAATHRVQRRGETVALAISLFPSLAVRWLIPRLNDFRRLHPEVEVELVNSLRQVDFARDGIDAAIRSGDGDWPGLQAEPLMREHLAPVCAPALAAELDEPGDLARQVLLRNAAHPEEWRVWREAAGIGDLPADSGPVFDASNEVLAAAVNGLGVAIGRHPLVADDLAAGRLVEPFPVRVQTADRYWLVAPAAEADSPALARFREWLVQVARVPD